MRKNLTVNFFIFGGNFIPQTVQNVIFLKNSSNYFDEILSNYILKPRGKSVDIFLELHYLGVAIAQCAERKFQS